MDSFNSQSICLTSNDDNKFSCKAKLMEMEKNAKNSGKLTDKSGPLVKTLRENILDYHNKFGSDFYEADVDRIKHDDWFVKKFLINCDRDLKLATSSLIESLKWRKSQRIFERNLNEFPAELFALGSFFVYEKDKNGRKTIYVRVKHFRRNKDLRSLLIQFGILIGVKLEAESPEGISVIMDFKGFGISNVDLEIMRSIIWTISNHFPFFVRTYYVVNLPRVLQAVSSMIISFVPSNARQLIHFLGEKNLIEFVDPKNLPDFLGGSCKRCYKGDSVVPKGCPTLIQYSAQQGWTVEQYRTIYKLTKNVFADEQLPLPPRLPPNAPSSSLVSEII